MSLQAPKKKHEPGLVQEQPKLYHLVFASSSVGYSSLELQTKIDRALKLEYGIPLIRLPQRREKAAQSDWRTNRDKMAVGWPIIQGANEPLDGFRQRSSKLEALRSGVHRHAVRKALPIFLSRGSPCRLLLAGQDSRVVQLKQAMLSKLSRLGWL